MRSRIVCVVEIVSSFEDKSFIFPFQNISEIDEYFGSFFRKMDYLMLSHFEYINCGDNLPPLNQRLSHQILAIKLNNIKNIDKNQFSLSL